MYKVSAHCHKKHVTITRYRLLLHCPTFSSPQGPEQRGLHNELQPQSHPHCGTRTHAVKHETHTLPLCRGHVLVGALRLQLNVCSGGAVPGGRGLALGLQVAAAGAMPLGAPGPVRLGLLGLHSQAVGEEVPVPTRGMCMRCRGEHIDSSPWGRCSTLPSTAQRCPYTIARNTHASPLPPPTPTPAPTPT
jgi:hypothetical protein